MSFPVLRLQDVRRLLRSSEEYELSPEAVQRLKWFQYNLGHGGNVSLTCRHFGISRSTFLRWAQRFDASDIRTLEECSRRPHAVRLPQTDVHTVELIRKIRMEQPTLGKESITDLLKMTHGVILSTSTVGRIIKRHNLFFAETASHQNKRTSMEDHTIVSPIPEKVSGVVETDFNGPFPLLVPDITS